MHKENKDQENGKVAILYGLSSIADPHHFDVDPDPDSAFHFDADPDPTFQSDADLDPTTHFFPDSAPPMFQNDL
jgi:hypothetical protein